MRLLSKNSSSGSVKHLILGYLDNENEFVTDTDASNAGFGGVLFQRKGNKEVVTAYFSKALSKSEMNYCYLQRVAMVKILQLFI